MIPARRALVTKIRAEGRAAFEAGKHAQTNPYPTYSTNRGQWDRGYHEAMWEHDDEDETEDYN